MEGQRSLNAAKSGRRSDQIGIWMTSAIVVGSMIGSGIFLLPVAWRRSGAMPLRDGWSAALGHLCIAFALAQLSRLGGDGIQAQYRARIRPDRRLPRRLGVLGFQLGRHKPRSRSARVGLVIHRPGIRRPGIVLDRCDRCDVALPRINAIGVRAAGGFSLVTVAIKLLPLLAGDLAVRCTRRQRAHSNRSRRCRSTSPMSRRPRR